MSNTSNPSPTSKHQTHSSNEIKNVSTSENSAPTKLEFSDKYDRSHSEQYLQKHKDGPARKLSNWRDCKLAEKALRIAGDPQTVLDLPCGAGRFWPLLLNNRKRKLYAADNSQNMIQVALKSQPADITNHITAFKTSAFDIDMPDGSVDSIFCMRLIHHVAQSQHRMEILKEFHRVCRDTVILSLWVDGNIKSWKRKRLETKRASNGDQQSNKNRFVVPREQVEQEFKQAGFTIMDKLDFLPGYAMWRIYILKKK